MVNIISRMRKLRSLLEIRNGPGAIHLPRDVTKLDLSFHKRLVGSHHRGPRHFWHEILPRIKYRNPWLPISVTRHDDADGPAYLRIYTAVQKSSQTTSAPSTTPASESDASEPTHTIEVKTMHQLEILEQLIEKTGAEVLPVPPEEAQEMEEMEEFKARADKDRVEVREKLMRLRREEELLKLARGEISSVS